MTSKNKKTKKRASFQIVRKEIHQNFQVSKYDVKQPSDAT